MEDRSGFLKLLGLGTDAGNLLDRNMIYEFRTGHHVGGEWITANPFHEYRPYLVDLWESKGNHNLLNAMVDKCLELAMEQDTRGWSVQRWNDEIYNREPSPFDERTDMQKAIDEVKRIRERKNGRKS